MEETLQKGCQSLPSFPPCNLLPELPTGKPQPENSGHESACLGRKPGIEELRVNGGWEWSQWKRSGLSTLNI